MKRNDLLRAIEYFLMNETYKLDFILIETNGLADPSSVIIEEIYDKNDLLDDKNVLDR